MGFGCLGGAHTGAPLLKQVGFKKIAERFEKTPAQVFWISMMGSCSLTALAVRVLVGFKGSSIPSWMLRMLPDSAR